VGKYVWLWVVLALAVLAAAFFWLRRPAPTIVVPNAGAQPHSQSQAASVASAIAGTASIFQAGASIFDDISSDS
jgi:hypothetical protein